MKQSKARSAGIHHITAITSDPQKNIDFYEGFLGQRLIKRTVNFDDPRAYHLYYADAYGTPGTLLTFFYWKDIPRGVRGAGETSRIAYGVARQAKDYWVKRAKEYNVTCTESTGAFGEEKLTMVDLDGLEIELVLTDGEPKVDWWKEGPVPEEAMLHGFYGVTLSVVSAETMESTLEGLGYKKEREEGNHTRYVAEGDFAHLVDLYELPNAPQARQGGGSVHHVAFRAATDEEELALRSQVAAAGNNPTPVIERNYFRSVYFMTPGGVLFEIATDGPGFTIDESRDELGENLVLPAQFEPHRKEIEALLAPITLPRNEHKDD